MTSGQFFLTSPVISLTLDSIMSFSSIRYVVKTSNCMQYSQDFAGVFSTMANTRGNLKETNEFSLICSVLESN